MKVLQLIIRGFIWILFFINIPIAGLTYPFASTKLYKKTLLSYEEFLNLIYDWTFLN